MFFGEKAFLLFMYNIASFLNCKTCYPSLFLQYLYLSHHCLLDTTSIIVWYSEWDSPYFSWTPNWYNVYSTLNAHNLKGGHEEIYYNSRYHTFGRYMLICSVVVARACLRVLVAHNTCVCVCRQSWIGRQREYGTRYSHTNQQYPW